LHYSMSQAWPLLCGLLVFVMVPGLALIGCGIVRVKNSLSQLIQVLMIIPLSCLTFSLLGFSLIFSSSASSLIGGLDFSFLRGIEGSLIEGVDARSFFFFQLSFFVVANALLVGVVGERASLKKMMVFCGLWGLLVYCPVGYWVWGEQGWLKQLGGLDFAGGLVVHVTTGFSALALTFHLKRRKDYFKLIEKYNNGLIFIGTFLVWIGWHGFNAGSTLVFNEQSIQAFLNTLLASSASLLVWFIVDSIHTPHQSYLSHLGMGIIAGLVAITPSAGFLGLQGSLVMGLGAGLLGNYSVRLMHKIFNQDDVLEVFSTHGVCGIWGCLGFIPLVSQEVMESYPSLFQANLWSVLAVGAYSFLISSSLIFLLGGPKNFLIDSKEELAGIDLFEHGEKVINLEGH